MPGNARQCQECQAMPRMPRMPGNAKNAKNARQCQECQECQAMPRMPGNAKNARQCQECQALPVNAKCQMFDVGCLGICRRSLDGMVWQSAQKPDNHAFDMRYAWLTPAEMRGKKHRLRTLAQLSQFEAKTSASPWFAVRQRPRSSLHLHRFLLGIGLRDLAGRDPRRGLRRK